MDWLGPGAFFLLLLLPAGVWFWLRPARWWGVHSHDGRLVFPTSIGLQVAGVFVAYIMLCGICLAFKQVSPVETGPLLIMFMFVFAGFSVLFRRIEIDSEGFSKKFLWSNRKMLWSETNDLIRLKNGTYVIAGESKHLHFDRRYADLEIMVLEIVKRLNEKRFAEAPAAEVEPPAAESGE